MKESSFLRGASVAVGLLILSPTGTFAAPPPNDTFANALEITGDSGTVSGTTSEATAEPGEPAHFGFPAEKSVWYKWIAPRSGRVSFDISNLSPSPNLHWPDVHFGTSVTSLTGVGARYASQVGLRVAVASFNAQKGLPYHFAVDGSSTSSTFTVRWFYDFTTSPLLAAVSPYARSVGVGTPATAYGTIINTGAAATGCRIDIPGGIPATFQYRASDASNNFIAPLNTPVNIPAGGTQNFVFGITPAAPIDSLDLGMVFGCTGTADVISLSGLNTFLLSASNAAVADVVSVSLTPTNDGITNMPGPTGTGIFVASTINIGAAASITASVDDNGRNLPLIPTLCRTDPSNGQCTNPTTPAPTATFTLGTNEIATFTVFATGAGTVPFDPANSRVFLRFTTSDGVTRGATSVAVRTQ